MSDPMVTVLTLTYNRASLLPRLHDSLTRQTYRGFEWLVVDDGSSDDTADVVARLTETSRFEIRYFPHPNRGRLAALNRGVAAARGSYCAVIDSDDWYEPEALAVLVSEWHALPAPDGFAEVQALCATGAGAVIGTGFPCRDRMDSDAFEMFFRHRVRGDKIGMIRTDLLRELRFPEDLGRYATESLLWYRLARRYRTRYLNRVLARKEYQADGLTHERAVKVLQRARAYHVLFKEIIEMPRAMPLKERYRAYVNWVRNAMLVRQPLRADLAAAPSRLLFLIAVPVGFLLAAHDRRRCARQAAGVTPDD
jgi:glycosyltransferase involved in cell wall biosynthesis